MARWRNSDCHNEQQNEDVAHSTGDSSELILLIVDTEGIYTVIERHYGRRDRDHRSTVKAGAGAIDKDFA